MEKHYAVNNSRKWWPVAHRGERQSVLITEMESMVLDCLCRGFQSRKITAELGISVHTMNSHCKSLIKKIDVGGTRASIVAKVWRGEIEITVGNKILQQNAPGA